MHPTRDLALLTLLLVPAGCSSGSSTSTSYVLRNTSVAVAGATRVAVAGRNLAFLASEGTTNHDGPGGTNYNAANGDADFIDTIAVAVDLQTLAESVLGVAALDLAWIGDELYLAVSESADSKDWNVDSDTADVVLLHWSRTANVLTRVDDLASASLPQFVSVGTNLFYTASTTPAGATMSNLMVIGAATPLAPVMIPTQDLAAELSPRILLEEEGLLFLRLDENDEGRDLDGDSDSTDARVLALLDGSDAAGVIRNVGLALPSDSGPFRARKTAAHDWDVGFLVSEADSGAANLNDPLLFDSAWQATQCVGQADADTNDDVLHFLAFAAWNTDPVTAPPQNTGLAAKDKIAIANGFVAAICAESDEGTCDLNQDGDTSDDVVRWTELVSAPSPVLPLNTAANLKALFDCPGGTHGLAELGAHFLIEASESDDENDFDGDGNQTKNLLGQLLPVNAATAWDFSTAGTSPYAGASWMAENPDRSRLLFAYLESVDGVNLNVHNPPLAGEDTDATDSLPVFGYFNGSVLSYPGVRIALSAANAGLVQGKNVVFYRVSEAADSRDWNEDGDETDFILYRSSLTDATSGSLGVLNNLTRNAVEFDPSVSIAGAAFLADESAQGSGADLNGDGDTTDLVVRYFTY